MKILKISLLVIFIVVIIIGILLFTSSKVSSTNELDKEYLIEKLVFQTNLNIYTNNSIKFSEKEVNGLISPRLKDKLNSKDGSSKLEFEKLYLDLHKDYIDVKGDIKNVPFVLTMKIDPTLENDRITFDSQGFKIGNLPVPNILLKQFGLSDIDDSLYIDTKDFDEISITGIDLFDNNIKINYKTNNDKIAEKYIKENQQNFVKNTLRILEQTSNSKSLANNIVKAVLLASADREIPKPLVEELKEDFIKLDNKLKAELVFTIIKYNAEYILNIIK